MIKKLEFLNDEDKNNLINQNKDMYVIAIEFGLKHNYITFSDTPLPEPEYDIWGTIKEQENKISILESENEKLNAQLSTVRASHSDLILDLDFRVMDIEDNLGLVPMNINLFKMIGEDNINSTFIVILDKIETGSYNTKEEIESICDRYLARGRITGEEYDMLMKALDKKESEKNSVEI